MLSHPYNLMNYENSWIICSGEQCSPIETIVKSVRQYKCFVLTDYYATMGLLFIRFGFTTKTNGGH